MKTVLIAHNFIAKSVSAMSYYLAYDLAQKGNRVIFISHKPFFSEKENIKVGTGEIIVTSWHSEKRPVTFTDFLWYLKIYRQYKPEVVIGHFVGSNITSIVSKFASFGRIKTVVYYHTISSAISVDLEKNGVLQKILRIRKRLFYNLFCDIIICPSEFGKTDLKANFSVEGVVVVNSIADRLKNKPNLSNDLIEISYLGRLDHTKGVLELIDAFEDYQRTNLNSKIILNIAGSGNLEKQVLKRVQEVSNIKFIGALSYDKVDAYLNASHFTIIPSKFDNLPTVGIESLMNKTPLLISNGTGLTKYLTDGKDCYKFDPTHDEICSVFLRVEKNIEMHREMQEEARATFLSKFTNEQYFDNISKILF